MARLNEPTQPATESLDTLKRRFIRQNRELAKANSLQSLRIRSLEGEVSRLLDENLSFREQIIKLHAEAGDNNRRQDFSRFESFKVRLEAKLKEVGDLVQELDHVKTNETKDILQDQLTDKKTTQTVTQETLWRKARACSDLLGDEDGRLPSIPEDKYYPRRTLDSASILGLLSSPANVTDSPDLGSPPIAHLEEGDPIKFDPSSDPVSHDIDESQSSILPGPLESRKKRRESFHGGKALAADAANHSESVQHLIKTFASDRPLKSGAKRKLNVRDDDLNAIKLGEDADYTQKKTAIASSGSHQVMKTASVIPKDCHTSQRRISATKGSAGDVRVAEAASRRTALGNKSVNTDPQSPAKRNLADMKRDGAVSKADSIPKVRERNRQKDTASSKQSAEVGKLSEKAVKLQIPPEEAVTGPETPRPLMLDLFSPESTEAAASRPEGRSGTPPPLELGSDNNTGSFGRASRRSRGAVSYVQPNLRDKMRRPGKELIDAVGAEERARRARAADAEQQRQYRSTRDDQDDDVATGSYRKTNKMVESLNQTQRAREEPTSPTDKKSSLSMTTKPTGDITNRKKRTSTYLKKENGAICTNSITSDAAGTGLASTSIDRKTEEDTSTSDQTRKQDAEPVTQHEPLERANIFDFSSSPDHVEKAAENDEAVKDKRTSRRHSSVAALSEHGKGSLSISRKADRRRESTVGLSLKEAMANEERLEQKSATIVAGIQADSEALALGRGERIANRRRSMML